MAIILAVVLIGYAVYRVTGRKLPAVLCVSLIGMALTYPASPVATTIAALTGHINFLALATPLLALLGCRWPRMCRCSGALAGVSLWCLCWRIPGLSSAPC